MEKVEDGFFILEKFHMKIIENEDYCDSLVSHEDGHLYYRYEMQVMSFY